MSDPNNTKKAAIPKLLKVLGILFVVFLCLIFAALFTMKPKELTIRSVDISAVKDGIYTGNADNGLVKASVSVKVHNGNIQNIGILEHDYLLGKPAEKIIDVIVKQQSLEVDTVTSATQSSNVLKKAVENALRQGE